MPDFKSIDGARAWSSNTANVSSVAVGNSQAPQGTTRAAPEFARVGTTFHIRTGARVTRARGLGVHFRRAWSNTKTFLQSVTLVRFAGVGANRIKQKAVRHAGYAFDKGINTIVEDMANGKLKSASALAARVQALASNADTLKTKGDFTDEGIAQRFQTNLQESLKTLRHADPSGATYQKVIGLLRNTAFAEMDDTLRPLTGDVRAVMTGLEAGGLLHHDDAFAKSMVPGLRAAATFGDDVGKAAAFSNLALKHDAFGGDADALQTWGSPSVFKAFGGNTELRDAFGGSDVLYREFGSNINRLKGGEGPRLVSDLVDRTFGAGYGQKFLDANRQFQDGFAGDAQVKSLGQSLSKLAEEVATHRFNPLDLTVETLLDASSEIGEAYEKFSKRTHTNEAVAYLRLLSDVQQRVQAGSSGPDQTATLRTDIGKLAKAMFATDDAPGPGDLEEVNVSANTRKALARMILKEAGRATGKGDLAEALPHLQSLSADQLGRVVGGFASAEKDLKTTMSGPINRFHAESPSRRPAGPHAEADIAFYKDLINQKYGAQLGSTAGDLMVEHLLQSKEVKALDDTDLRRLETRLAHAPIVLSPPKLKSDIAQKDFLPKAISSGWLDTVDRTGGPEVTTHLSGTIGSGTSYGGPLGDSYKKQIVDIALDEQPDPEMPEVTKQFAMDVNRGQMYLNAPDGTQVRLNRDNAVAALTTFAGNDADMAKNLSALLHQGAYNAMTVVFRQHINPGIEFMKQGNPSYTKPRDGGQQEAQVSVGQDGRVRIDYDWRMTMNTLGVAHDRVHLDPQKSRIKMSVSLEIGADDLRTGNFGALEMSDITYDADFALNALRLNT